MGPVADAQVLHDADGGEVWVLSQALYSEACKHFVGVVNHTESVFLAYGVNANHKIRTTKAEAIALE